MVDAVVAYGSAVEIAGRLVEHLEAGADDVLVHVLASPDKLVGRSPSSQARWV